MIDSVQCLQLLREIKSVSFASVDDKGKPQNRIVDVMYVDNEKSYFCTARAKPFYKQIMLQKDVAIVGLSKEYKMVQLNGVVKRVDNQKEMIDLIFEHNPVMNEVYPEQSRYILEAFCIEEGIVQYFDITQKPIYRTSFILGNYHDNRENINITNNCIACGKCTKVCPQQCIVAGQPYRIKQEHCLHCGLCIEHCLVDAIEKGVK